MTALKGAHADDSGKKYQGRCFCASVLLTATGRPVAMASCHCESCRFWSSGPVNSFSLWQPQALRVTRGADKIASYSRGGNTPNRKWCSVCGDHLMTEHEGMKLVDLYIAMLPDYPQHNAEHIWWQQTRQRMKRVKPEQESTSPTHGDAEARLVR